MEINRISKNWKVQYFSLWMGQSSSLFGSAITQFILIWWITSTTKSAISLTLASFCGLLPQAIFGAFGGVFADRYDRKRIMIITDFISALCIFILVIISISNSLKLWQVLTMMAIRSTMQAFQSPASLASINQMVPENWLVKSASLNQMTGSLSSILAAPLGAFVISFVPLHYALLIDIVTALIAITMTSFIYIPKNHLDVSKDTHVIEELKEGIIYSLKNKGILILIGISCMMLGVLIPVFSLLPLYVVKELEGTIKDVALLESLGSFGMVLGALIVMVIKIPKKEINFILWLFTISNITIILMGVLPKTMFLSFAFFWTLGAILYSIAASPMISILQKTVPNELQGRVLSLYSTFIGLAGPLGLIFMGIISEYLGMRTTFIISGLIATLICILGFFSKNLMSIDKIKR